MGAAGLDYAPIADWVEKHGEAAFKHPTYASLCLRWGQNDHGYNIKPLPPLVKSREPVYFTPRTCWRTFRTFYHLATPLDSISPLLAALQAQAGLTLCALKDHGLWKGWATLNLPAAQRVVAEYGYQWALQQRHSLYEVVLYPHGEEKAPLKTWQFTTAEQARHWYNQLPGKKIQSVFGPATSPTVTLGHSEVLGGEIFNSQLSDEKTLPVGWCIDTLSLLTPPALPTSMPRDELTNADRPFDRLILSVAEVLTNLRLPRREVAARLGITSATLHRRERDPEMWTIAELQRVAQLTQWPLDRLAELIAQEVYP